MAIMVKKEKGAKPSTGKAEKKEKKKSSRKTGADKGIDEILKLINKEHGEGLICRYGDRSNIVVPAISTGSIQLDKALGIGGIPRGRVVEYYGREATGKTTLALHSIAAAQKAGDNAAFVDVEHALDPTMATNIGVAMDKLIISQPDYGEQALEVVQLLVESGNFAIIVVDSVAALVPKAEIEGEMGQSHMGLQARLMSQAMRKLTSIVAKSKTCVLFINQVREKIGVMFGDTATTTGGNALKFYSSVRIELRRIGALKRGDDIIGNHLKIKVIKNKLAPPFREIETDLVFGYGIDHERELLSLGVEIEAVDKSGAWYSYGKERLGQGVAATADFLKAHPDIAARILTDIEVRNASA